MADKVITDISSSLGELNLQATIAVANPEQVKLLAETRDFLESVQVNYAPFLYELEKFVSARVGDQIAINTQESTNYSLKSTDKASIIRMKNGGLVHLSSEYLVPFPIGTIIIIKQIGDLGVTLVPTDEVTVNEIPANLTTTAKGQTLTLIKVASDTWDLNKTVSINNPTSEVDRIAELEAKVAKLSIDLIELARFNKLIEPDNNE